MPRTSNPAGLLEGALGPHRGGGWLWITKAPLPGPGWGWLSVDGSSLAPASGHHTSLKPRNISDATSTALDLFTTDSMFSRLSQVARHLSRPLPNVAHASAATLRSTMANTMATGTTGITAAERARRQIHTAACLIIGDEVLGGKAGREVARVDGCDGEADRLLDACRPRT